MASAETNVGIRIGTGGSEEQVIKALDDIRLSILKLNEDTQKSCNAMLQTYKNYSENVIKVDLVKEARAESIRIKTAQTIKESQSRITNWEKTEAIKRTTFSEQNATKNININNKTAAEIKLIEEKQTQLIATENAKRIASAEKTASAIKLIKTKQAHEDLRLEQTRIAQTNGRADGGIGARFGNYMIGNAIGGIASSLPGGQILGPMAEMGFGLSGMAGAMGGTLAVVGALGAVAGACAIAVEGLHSFGSFLLNDIIKPQMKADTQYQQLANRSQGRIEAEELSQAAAKARVSHNITLEESNAGFEAFLKKGGEYKDMARALEVASISKQAYGGAVENKMNLLAELHQPNENMETTVRHFFAFEGL